MKLLLSEYNIIYDCVEAETMESQASFSDYSSLKRGSTEHEMNNLKTSMIFPFPGHNAIID